MSLIGSGDTELLGGKSKSLSGFRPVRPGPAAAHTAAHEIYGTAPAIFPFTRD